MAGKPETIRHWTEQAAAEVCSVLNIGPGMWSQNPVEDAAKLIRDEWENSTEHRDTKRLNWLDEYALELVVDQYALNTDMDIRIWIDRAIELQQGKKVEEEAKG